MMDDPRHPTGEPLPLGNAVRCGELAGKIARAEHALRQRREGAQ
jgi:hypothetical protein